jgi:cobalt-zinc-cadmium efflux system outer membrane protein
MTIYNRSVWLPVVALQLAGCASLPADRGYSTTAELVESRTGVRPAWSFDTSTSQAVGLPTGPLTVEEAVRWSLLNSPRVRAAEARLGFGRAQLEAARRVSNPTFGYGELYVRDGDGEQITRSYTFGLTDLLMLSARTRLATGELDRQGQLAAVELLDHCLAVEVAWYDAVATAQIVRLRESIATAADSSAQLAQRFLDAGNMDRLSYSTQRAAAAEAHIDLLRARDEARRARAELAALLALPTDAAWSTLDELPPPAPVQLDPDRIVQLALEQRLDLAAARRTVSLREDALGVVRRWRWLGSVEVGHEHESEVDGGVIRGPSLSIELPIFNQGQGAVAEAQAELVDARAHLDELVLGVEREARLGIESLAGAHAIAEHYRTELLPPREEIVERTQERVNFMLTGVFELISVKKEQYDAYEGYLAAVRDYWVRRARLRSLAGGRLPDEPATEPPAAPAAEPATHDHAGDMQ